MSESYQEMFDGQVLVRQAPGARHETICARLHQHVALCLAPHVRLLVPRFVVQLSPGNVVRPDLAVTEADSGKLWLVAEIVHAADHSPDTVIKKDVYAAHQVPRLWILDPRYDNLEVYHHSPYGLVLTRMLAGKEILCDESLPGLELTVGDLFRE